MKTPNSRSTSRRWARRVGTGATAVVAVTAIGSAAGAASAPADAPVGASGSVASLAVSSMEVQNPNSGQTTVSWTSSTQFSQTVSMSVSSLAAGDCVTVTGRASKSSKTTIAARSISVSPASSTGSCTIPAGPVGAAAGGGATGSGNFRFRTGGGPGGFGGGTGGTRPSFPAGSGRGVRGLASLTIARGKVTSVNGSTVSVSGFDLPSAFRPPAKSGNAKTKMPAKLSTPKTEKLKITTSSSTTLTETQPAAATNLAVGDCVNAFGPAAANGAITASTVRITSTGGTSCTGGFGRFGGGGGYFRGGAPGGGNA